MKQNEIYFAKLHKDAKIPTKRVEDGGYDLYPAFDEKDITIYPGETKMIPTGICSAFSSDYVCIEKERGSTGTKGMRNACGVVDSGYRGEWFVPINNTSSKIIVIAKNVEEYVTDSAVIVVYPYDKAISQFIVVPVPQMTTIEVSPDMIMNIASERGTGALGSSEK